jgi:hypothetical protein
MTSRQAWEQGCFEWRFRDTRSDLQDFSSRLCSKPLRPASGVTLRTGLSRFSRSGGVRHGVSGLSSGRDVANF